VLTVHHLGVSQSERIVWLCEELEIPYTLLRYERDPDTRLAPPNYKALHPFGTAPVVTDGSFVLGESGAIIDYVIAKHGGGRLSVAPESPAFADYLYWFHFANGSMMPTTIIDIIITMVGGPHDNFTLHALRDRVGRAFDLIDKRLGEADYLAGSEFTAADIMMLFPLTTARMFAPRDLTPYRNIRGYLTRIGARRAYRRAMKKAEPDLTPLLT
jgi:glutathione S-transferase